MRTISSPPCFVRILRSSFRVVRIAPTVPVARGVRFSKKPTTRPAFA